MGASPGALRSLDEALSARELVKVRMRAPTDKKRTAEELAASAGAALCGLIGHTAILYRPHPVPEERLIELPAGGSDG
jgi:RNA-binding protein